VRWLVLPCGFTQVHRKTNKDQLSLTNPHHALHHGECAGGRSVVNLARVQVNDAQHHSSLTCTRAKLTTLRVESCQFSATSPAFNLPHLHLAPSLRATPFEFCRDFWKSSWAIVWHCLRDPTLSRFSRTPTCDRWTDSHDNS